MVTEDFNIAWNKLSPIQREAADWKEGPLLVLAGPGSGKTRVLTCHIARILDANPNDNFRVLSLTFTNKAADEMRARVIRYVPQHEGRIFIGTIHSFCADILRQHGTHLNISPNFNIYSQNNDLQTLLNEAVETVDVITNFDEDLLKKTLPVIQRLKSRLVLPESSHKELADPKMGELIAIVYQAYESKLTEHNALDFNSLILKVYQLFIEFPAFAKRYRTVYPYICIDEFQDTNHAQYSLIRALTGDKHRNLYIVADDDQIIYQWNGASYRRITDFTKDYLPEVIQLPVTYRCPPEIVELANNLIRYNILRTPNKKPLEAFRQSYGEGNVRLIPAFSDFESEAEGIAKDIGNLHSNHLDSVAILGRSRRILDFVELAFKNEGIPAVISQRKDEFKSSPFVWLHSILRLANDRRNRNYLEAVCGSFNQITEVEIDPDFITMQAHASNRDYFQQWLTFAHQNTRDTSVKTVISTVSQCLSEGKGWSSLNTYILDWFASLVRARQQAQIDSTAEVFAQYEEERSVWIDLIREISQSPENNITLEALLQELQIRSKESFLKPNTVTLMTIHGAKGKEFHHVYLIGLFEDELPSFQSKQKGENSPEMEEERRSCFVAITRVIESLTLSYSEKYRGWPKEPSRFLFEMGLLK